jgi:cellulose synthase/poly-beta-1,6-N-acetylglucosamine synthase-like glycosyltransferase
MKEKNQKKINSHRWFFNAFGACLRPKSVVIDLDDMRVKTDDTACVFCLMSGPNLVRTRSTISGKRSISIPQSVGLVEKSLHSRVCSGRISSTRWSQLRISSTRCRISLISLWNRSLVISLFCKLPHSYVRIELIETGLVLSRLIG